MADLIMDYNSISSLAQEISNTQMEFDQLLTNLEAMVSSTNSIWHGNAQVEFATTYSNLKPKLETISSVLKNYAEAISATVANEQNLESAHAKSLSTNVVIPTF